MPGVIDKYSSFRAAHYQHHHQKNVRARLTSIREQHVLYQCLVAAGNPATVLDVPCGTGRLWPAFARARVCELIGADNSAAMLEAAERHRLAPHLPARLINTSAFAMDLADDAVDLVACQRFYHHLSRLQDRQRLLSELKRVSRTHIALSLWVDGNLASSTRLRRRAPLDQPGYGRRICRRRDEVEAEFADAGLTIVQHYDVWPLIQMWRTYLLKHDLRAWGQS